MEFIKKRFGESLVFLASILWGCISIFTRPMLTMGFQSIQIVAMRAFITTIVVGLVMLIKNPKMFKIKVKDCWLFFGTGIMSFLFFNFCYMSSIGENSASIACILMCTSIIWVAGLSIPLFKEKLTSNKVIAFILCFSGCVLTCLSGELKITPIGLLFGLGSGLGYAFYSLFGKVAVQKYDSLTVLFYSFLFSSIGAVFLCNWPTLIPLISQPKGLGLCSGISIICTVIAYFAFTLGMSKIGPAKASIIDGMEPAVATVAGAIAFGENPGIIGAIGVAVVIAGLVYLEVGKPISFKRQPKLN